MTIRVLFPAIFFVGGISLASCDGDASKMKTKTVDSTTTKIPLALSTLNKQLLADPNNAELYYQRANYYLNDKQINNGLTDILHCVSIDSTKSNYYLTLSELYFASNKTSNSKAALEKSIQLDDHNTEALLKLAELYFYVKKTEQSFEYINRVLKINNYNAKAYYMKGMNYKELGDTAKAISSMQTAVEQDQSYYNAYMQLGILTGAQKKPLALQYYKNALRIQPNSTETWYDIGKYYQDMADWNKAIETYNTLLKIDPRFKNALYNLGVINLVGLKDEKAAVTNFSQAIQMDPSYVDAYYGRGVSYQTMGDKKNAVADFQTCLSINPQYEMAQIALKKLGVGK